MSTHTDPMFYTDNGFCRTDCDECTRLDAEEGLGPDAVIAEGIALALAAARREEAQRNGHRA